MSPSGWISWVLSPSSQNHQLDDMEKATYPSCATVPHSDQDDTTSQPHQEGVRRINTTWHLKPSGPTVGSCMLDSQTGPVSPKHHGIYSAPSLFPFSCVPSQSNTTPNHIFLPKNGSYCKHSCSLQWFLWLLLKEPPQLWTLPIHRSKVSLHWRKSPKCLRYK